MRIAVIGTGISGMLAARLLHEDHEVHVFEANDYLGGHTNTIEVEAFGRSYSLDTGFMVFNHRTYPNFVRMLRLLDIPEQDSDMSFSVRCLRTGLEYQGSSLGGLVAQRRNLVRPAFYRMLLDVLRFNRKALELVEREEDTICLGDFLDRHRFGKQFTDYYLVPMGASIWSARPKDFHEFPARFIVRFFDNHGLLTVRGHPKWKTIRGGAKEYVQALMQPLADRIRLGCPVKSVSRREQHVLVTTATNPPEQFDAVVMAAHADQTLKMLADSTEAEREILGAFPYQENEAIVHTDPSLLPQRRRAWASWNCCNPRQTDRPVVLTYNLNRLQRHKSPEPILLTLNRAEAIDPARILRRIAYQHPVYGTAALSAQKRYAEINGKRRTYFCGAYWGYGFHEDGVNSALAVGECFGKNLDSCTVAST
ncbi:MAG: NAD(P)/FAD-dependent oxidoreductase [Planctomycetota bacterium]|jgi:predicted NAD/FAD-binding protein